MLPASSITEIINVMVFLITRLSKSLAVGSSRSVAGGEVVFD
jgi:hypothetical protein